MLEMISLASSSRGNCHALLCDTSWVVLDVGMNPLDVARKAGRRLNCCAAALVTHEHRDHANYADAWTRMGVPVPELWTGHLYDLGWEWQVAAAEVPHDVPCNALLVRAPTRESVAYITDCAFSPVRFASVTHWLVEANYDEEILLKAKESGEIDTAQYERVRRSHMSIRTCVDMLRSNDLSKTREIRLVHLSRRHADQEKFRDLVQRATGKLVTVAEE
ncbi:MAG: hypothetical protein KGL39_50370 [Patescibacteria group bacterium]|nr:hypothetical protein [Patescibacteria group bacterium]